MRAGEGMTVGSLIEELQQYDEDMPVLLMQQPSWPFEYSLDGVVSRSEIDANHENGPRHEYEPSGEAPKDEDDEIPCLHCGGTQDESQHEVSKEEDCVFLLEGTQLRYGTKEAWYGR